MLYLSYVHHIFLLLIVSSYGTPSLSLSRNDYKHEKSSRDITKINNNDSTNEHRSHNKENWINSKRDMDLTEDDEDKDDSDDYNLDEEYDDEETEVKPVKESEKKKKKSLSFDSDVHRKNELMDLKRWAHKVNKLIRYVPQEKALSEREDKKEEPKKEPEKVYIETNGGGKLMNIVMAVSGLLVIVIMMIASLYLFIIKPTQKRFKHYDNDSQLSF